MKKVGANKAITVSPVFIATSPAGVPDKPRYSEG
jgi:hypothetical protein